MSAVMLEMCRKFMNSTRSECQEELEDLPEEKSLSATSLNLLSPPCRLEYRAEKKMDGWI